MSVRPEASLAPGGGSGKVTDTVALGRGAVFDLRTLTLFDGDGHRVQLGHQAKAVLKVLAERLGQTVTKDDLLSNAWGGLAVSENNLVQCVRQIRLAIDDRDATTLRNVPKVGYLLVPQVDTAPLAPVKGGREPFGLSLILVTALGLLGLAIALLTGYGGGTPDAQLPVSSYKEARGPSIAVLPFQDMTGEERWARLGRGIAVDLSGALARHPDLDVFAGADKAAAGVRALPATYLLDGTLLAQADRLRLTARLLEAPEGRVLWTDSWSGPAEDLFAWHDEILSRVTSSISAVWTGALSREVLQRSSGRATENLHAYELFLLGSAEKHEFTAESLGRAVVYLEQAVELDPGFARAWVALDLARLYLADTVSSAEEAVALRAGSLEAQRRAYAADPEDPQVLVRYSGLLAIEGKRASAAEMLRRAVAEAPSDADILAQAAFSAAWRGIVGDEPVGWARRSLELNLDPPQWYRAAEGLALFHAGRVTEAAQALVSVRSMGDALMIRAAAEALSGDLDAARDTAREVAETAPRLVAMDLAEGGEDIPSWQAFLDGAALAGLPMFRDEN